MSIIIAGRMYEPTCNICGSTLQGEFDFMSAVKARKQAGWKSQKEDGQWVDICCDCQSQGGTTK